MSTTIVHRGLHSCLKLQSVESMTLRLNLVPHKPQLPEPITAVSSPPHVSDVVVSKGEATLVHDDLKNRNGDNNANTSHSEFAGWSFIESLTKEAQEGKETPYVHPLDKSCSSVLGKKSLEICTESLGSETGSEIGDENDPYFSSSDSETRKSPIRERSRFCQLVHKKEIHRSFPPPLTSISGSDHVQCTPHRKGGRLVIKAISISTAQTCFEAERSDGRLRLHFKNSCSKSSTCSDEDTEDDEDQMEKQDQRKRS